MSTENNAACSHCGMHHVARCPAVQAIEYYPDGTIKRVEYIKQVPVNNCWQSYTWDKPGPNVTTWHNAR